MRAGDCPKETLPIWSGIQRDGARLVSTEVKAAIFFLAPRTKAVLNQGQTGARLGDGGGSFHVGKRVWVDPRGNHCASEEVGQLNRL